MKKKMIVPSSKLNFISNLCGFFITYSIGFFLSPFLVKTLGADAYGFVSLAQSFTNYVSLVTVALNSMASRFISIAIFQGKLEKAKKYYSSVIISNAIITGILIIPCSIFIIFLERFITVPEMLLVDVKVLFAVIFGSFFISLLTSLFGVGVFVENRLYLNAVHNAEASVLRLTLTVLFFGLFPAKVFYIGVISLITNLYIIMWQRYYMIKYQPGLTVNLRSFEKSKVVELIKAGSWSLVSQISFLLNSGFDLLLANQFVNSSAMGVLAISATLPSIIYAIFSSVSTAFTPNLTKQYSIGQYDEMLSEIIKSFRMMNLVLIVPLAGLTVFGGDFYALWQPTQDASMLQLLSVIKILILTFTAGLATVHEVFVIANKLKAQSIATLVSGILNIIFVLILLKTTNLGIIAVAGAGAIIGLLRNFCFTFPYAAKCLNQKWYVFYGFAFRAFLIYIFISVLFYFIRRLFFVPTSWLGLIVVSAACGFLGVVIVALLILKREEKKNLISKLLAINTIIKGKK